MSAAIDDDVFAICSKREHAFLHARAAARDDCDQRTLLACRQLRRACQPLADHDAHAPTEKGEIEHRQHDRLAADGRGATEHPVRAFGALLLRLQSIQIGLIVGKSERIGRIEIGLALLERVRIDEISDPAGGGNAEVALADRADAEPGEIRCAFEQRIAPIARFARGKIVHLMLDGRSFSKWQKSAHKMGLLRYGVETPLHVEFRGRGMEP